MKTVYVVFTFFLVFFTTTLFFKEVVGMEKFGMLIGFLLAVDLGYWIGATEGAVEFHRNVFCSRRVRKGFEIFVNILFLPIVMRSAYLKVFNVWKLSDAGDGWWLIFFMVIFSTMIAIVIYHRLVEAFKTSLELKREDGTGADRRVFVSPVDNPDDNYYYIRILVSLFCIVFISTFIYEASIFYLLVLAVIISILLFKGSFMMLFRIGKMRKTVVGFVGVLSFGLIAIFVCAIQGAGFFNALWLITASGGTGFGIFYLLAVFGDSEIVKKVNTFLLIRNAKGENGFSE